MPSLSEEHQSLLVANLESDYLSLLPPLLQNTKPPEDEKKKNLSRALSAFTLRHLLDISGKDAAEAVIDDFNDVGIDAVYLHGPSQALYFVQTKLKKGEEFKQHEALAFCQGVRKLLVQDFTGFNEHFTRRQAEIEDALNECDTIHLVIAHISAGISHHASSAISDLIADPTHGDERLSSNVIHFDATRIVPALQASRANLRVDATLTIHKWGQLSEPRETFFGYAKLTDLITLHSKERSALFDKNIRLFLGPKTSVSQAIQKTLEENPKHFFYLNNGITVLCEKIDSKSTTQRGSSKRLKIEGFSIINGAQTVSSASQFLKDNPTADISEARVSITLIRADADSAFGKSVTRSRNHQNTVEASHFLALDDEQERLRRELAVLGIQYSYKAEQNDGVISDTKMKAAEAVHALALFHPDPRYILWLKNESSSLLDIFSNRYKGLITSQTTAFNVANAIRFSRYVNMRMYNEAKGTGPEKLTYKHGSSALSWILAKRVRDEQRSARLFLPANIANVLSVPFDELRQALWDQTSSALADRTPLVMYRSQTRTIPIVEKTMLENYQLTDDPIIPIKRAARSNRKEAYPEDLFNYMILKAPQIGGLL